MTHSHGEDSFKKGSISLGGAVGMGTGVMIGAGIFALTGQIAQLAGPYFALSFVLGAIVTSFSAYSYIKMSNAWPTSGGIAMILQKAYGPGAIAAAAALLMALSMVISAPLLVIVVKPLNARIDSATEATKPVTSNPPVLLPASGKLKPPDQRATIPNRAIPPILMTAKTIERSPTDRFPEMFTRNAKRITPTANIGTSGPPAMSKGRKT